MKEDDVPQILLHKVIVGKDVVAAEKELVKLPGLIRYRKSLKSKVKDEHFIDHLRKYIFMYQTDCPWEVSTTNRYTITNYEAAVTARKRVKQGETIKYLTGTLVPLSTAESMDLDMTNRNFSIVVNARKKSDQMFLGPARFANHDCSPNGRLIMKGIDSMEVKADKNINIGDEITVSYGDNYFGPDNVECLCHTCEVHERNGWTSKASFTATQSGASTPVPDVRPAKVSVGKKRKQGEASSFSPQPARMLKKLKPIVSPSKLQYSWTPPSTSESEIAPEETADKLAVDHEPKPPSRSPARINQSITPKRDGKGRFLSSASKANTEPKGNSKTQPLTGERRKSFPLSPSTTSPSSQDSENEPSTDTPNTARRVGVPVMVKMEAVEKTTVETDLSTNLLPQEDATIMVKDQQQSPESLLYDVYDIPDTPENPDSIDAEDKHDTPDDVDVAMANDEPHISVPQAISTLTLTKVSTIASIEPLPDRALPLSPAANAADIVPSIEALNTTIKTVTKAKVTVTALSDSIRVPGDYILTRKLLAQPHDRWIRCQNGICHTFFLQPNGYQTRRECPRCERHSMLYGFPWPKTDPDPRKLLSRVIEAKSNRGRPRASTSSPTTIVVEEEPMKKRLKSEISPTSKYTAYRRQGRCGKGTWVEGGGDEEERVMDHRTIHRFVLPDEERELTRKGLLIEAESVRAMGDGELDAFAALDGRRARFKREGRSGSFEGRESTGLYGSGTDREDSVNAWEDVDAEGRRRSNRIVESRVYVNVNMRR